MTEAPLSIAEWTVPDHVPPELVVDVDYFNIPGIENGPHEPWYAIREKAPRVFFSPRHGGHWVLTRVEDVRAALAENERFTSYPNAIPKTLLFGPYPQPPTGAEPPESLSYRALLMPFFTPAAVRKLEGFIRDLTIELIEEIRLKGECEFIGDFGQRMPIGIFLKLMGLPDSDRKLLLKLAMQRIRGRTNAERLEGLNTIKAYAEAKILERRANPTGDLLSSIANGVINGELIKVEQARAMTVTTMFAGLDTVVNALGLITRFLATSTEHRRKLIKQPDLIKGNATDELLRRFAGPNIVRCSKIDQEFQGVHMRAGDQILNVILMTSLDEDVYPNPFEVDFARPHNPVVSFGAGAHRCVGAHLARLEVVIFLQEWLGRIPEFQLDPEKTWRAAGGAVPGIEYLPLVWDPATTTTQSLR